MSRTKRSLATDPRADQRDWLSSCRATWQPRHKIIGSPEESLPLGRGGSRGGGLPPASPSHVDGGKAGAPGSALL